MAARHLEARMDDNRPNAPRSQPGASESPRSTRSAGGQRMLMSLLFNFVAPIALYYALRSVGVSIYLTLVIGAVAPLLGAGVSLIRREKISQLGLFMMTMLLLSAGVALLTGSPRFLLAKDGWLTGVSGVWMLCSVRAQRPLTFLFARPLLEGVMAKMAGAAPASWDSLWEQEPRFQRIWRVATVIWGLALLVDAAIRVVMAYTLPIDLVPALGGALWPVTFLVLQVVVNVYFHRAGFWRLLRGDLGAPA